MRPIILVLFDSASIRNESLQYSLELAKRMNSSLMLLVILSVEGWKNTTSGIGPMLKQDAHVREILGEHIKTMKNETVSVEVAVKMGNPKSELVKYLAETGRVETIVWGGIPDLMNRKDHWLVQMKDILECPVVTPYKRSTQS